MHLLKLGAKPVPQRRERHTYDALDFLTFSQPQEEEKKEERPDEKMENHYKFLPIKLIK